METTFTFDKAVGNLIDHHLLKIKFMLSTGQPSQDYCGHKTPPFLLPAFPIAALPLGPPNWSMRLVGNQLEDLDCLLEQVQRSTGI